MKHSVVRKAKVMEITVNILGEIEWTFEKTLEGGTVNIYNVNGVEFDMFTNYEIGDDMDKFENACMEYIRLAFEE